MGIASYNVQLRTHTQKKSFLSLSLFFFFCNVCNGKSAYLPSKKEKKTLVENMQKANITKASYMPPSPRQQPRLNTRAISRFHSWNSHHDK